MGSTSPLIGHISLLAMLALICQPASFADEVAPSNSLQEQPLQAQQATMDSKKEKPVLNGVVERRDKLDDNQSATGAANQEGNATAEPEITIEPSTLNIDPAQVQRLIKSSRGFFQLFLGANGANLLNPTEQLSRQTPKLSPEEYRRMEYGIIGLDSFIQVGGPGPVVTKVYPGSPAQTAGIRRGDLIVKARDHVFKPGEGQRVLWQVIAGRAGTPVDMTVLRNGELVTVEMIRMNIEDIDDKVRRRQYESLLDTIGAPHYTSEGDLLEHQKKDANDLRNVIRLGGGKKLKLDLDSLRNSDELLNNTR